jgi:flagellar protein FlaG
MASASVSSLIIFIASLVVAASVAGTLVTQVGDITHSVTDSSEDVEKNINTDIAIISDAGRPDSIYDGSAPITVLVKNTGSGTLATDPGQLDVLVNGSYVGEGDLTVTKAGGGGGSWGPGEVVKVAIDYGGLETGDHRVTVIVNGNEEVLRFRH